MSEWPAANTRAGRPGWSVVQPGGNRRLAEPHRQIAALTQTRFVGWPIGQPTLLLRDVVAALGVGLEGHGGHPGSGVGQAFYPVLTQRQISDPCTNAADI